LSSPDNNQESAAANRLRQLPGAQEAQQTRRRWISLALVVGALTVLLVVWLRWPGSEVPVEPPAKVQPSRKGWQIRYNATVALLVKGSKRIPFDNVLEMLDENVQLKNFRVKLKNGKDVPDETGARKTILNTLKAIGDWHKKQGKDNSSAGKDWQRVYAAIKNLAENSPNAVVRTEALRTKQTLSQT
jgi:hypothetical protein